ncbi:hypothetical protein D1872_294100 [compost metagenome]
MGNVATVQAAEAQSEAVRRVAEEAQARAEQVGGDLAEKSEAGVVQLSIFDDEPPAKKPKPAAAEDAGMRQIVNMVKNADLMNMTPLEAMQLVNELKQKAKHL